MELFQLVNDSDRVGPFYDKHSIGEDLGLPQSAISEIQKSFQDATKRKEAYLEAYTHQHPCPSWSNVARTLRSCDLYQHAANTENTYVQGKHLQMI